MKKGLKGLLLVLVLVLGVAVITGCEKKDTKSEETTKKEEKKEEKKNGLIGTWELSEDDFTMTMIFKDEQKGSYKVSEGKDSDESDFTYKKDDKKLTIVYGKDEDKLENVFTYTLKDNKLTLTTDTDDTYTLTRK